MYKGIRLIVALTFVCLAGFMCPGVEAQQTRQDSRDEGQSRALGLVALPPEVRQFDFYIGRWSIQQVGGGTATDDVQTFAGGLALLETSEAQNFFAASVSVLNLKTGLWTQTYNDTTDLYVQLTGGMRQDRMVLEGEFTDPIDGRKKLARLTYFNITAQAFDQTFEISQDGGQSWFTFRFHFVRR
jgi:hypothetical protein